MIRFAVAALASLAVIVPHSIAQDGPPQSPTLPEHDLLKKFVGAWACDAECVMGPNGETQKSTGTVNSRMLGDLWVINELQFDSPGSTMKGLQTIGYDAEKGQYVGTWVDSVMNHQWNYTGSVNDSGDTLILEATGPLMTGEQGTAQYRDMYQFLPDGRMKVTSQMQQADGSWATFMSGISKKTDASE